MLCIPLSGADFSLRSSQSCHPTETSILRLGSFFVFTPLMLASMEVWRTEKSLTSSVSMLTKALCRPLRDPQRWALSEADSSLRSSQSCHHKPTEVANHIIPANQTLSSHTNSGYLFIVATL